MVTEATLRNGAETTKTGRQEKKKTGCACGATSAGRMGLCNTCRDRWKRGDITVVPKGQPKGGARKIQGPCSECGETSKAKGLCGKHYRRMMHQAKRANCIIPRCGKKKSFRARYFCSDHSECSAPRCKKKFKARRLCRDHYRKMYLAPKQKDEKRRAKERQGEFLIADGAMAPEEGLERTGKSIRLDIPIVNQVQIDPEEAQTYQKIADALFLLKRNGVLPEHMIETGRSRTTKMIANHTQAKD